MKINANFTKKTVLLAILFYLLFWDIGVAVDNDLKTTHKATVEPTVENFLHSDGQKTLQKPRTDGTPLQLSREYEHFLQYWNRLEKNNHPDIPGTTGFISLNRQSRAFHEKTIYYTGRLLQTNIITTKEKEGIIYESWVLLDDEKRIPVRLLTKSIPRGVAISDSNNPPLKYGNDIINGTGIYYRLIPFSDGKDLYNTPLIIGLNFDILSTPRLDQSYPKRANSPSFTTMEKKRLINWKLVSVLIAFILMWIVFRRFIRYYLGKTGTKPLLLLTLCLLTFSGIGMVYGQKMDTVPESVVDMLYRLKERNRPVWNGDDIQGTLLDAVSLPLAPSIQQSTGISRIWRCSIKKTDQELPVMVYTVFMPEFEINRQGRSFFSDVETPMKSGIGEIVGGSVLPVTISEKEKCFVLLRLGWYPKQSVLGILKVNATVFDRVPVYPVHALARLQSRNQNKEEIDKQRQEILQSLRFTEKDREMVYELLSAVARLPKGQWDHFIHAVSSPSASDSNSKKEASCSIVELFNRPEQYQGELFRIYGHVRRVLYIPINDPEIVKRYGLDHYYQLYLYTTESQGYPLVISVPKIPKDMPIGSNKGYRENIAVTALFCKSWAYKTERIPLASTNGKESEIIDNKPDKWIRAPFFIGSEVQWFPETDSTFPEYFPWSYFWGTFIGLLLLFFLYKCISPYLRRR